MLIKRTLMYENRELLDFEVDLATNRARVLDSLGANDGDLPSYGIDPVDLDASVTHLVRGRCMSDNRDDLHEILNAFGAGSAIELTLMGQGASLTDHFWYRAPGSTAHWEDVNFFDNDWDGAFRTTFLTGDYASLATCTPDVPDVTTGGHQRKAWEKNAEGVFLLKEPMREDGADLEGSILASELCALLYGAGSYQPLSVRENHGKRLSVTPLMFSRDEELVQGRRMLTMCGMSSQEVDTFPNPVLPQDLIDVFTRAGVQDFSAQVARVAAFKNLALLNDLHSGNYGVICNLQTGERRAAPVFDYDHSFGFPSRDYPLDFVCENPQIAMLLCAQAFSDIDPTWDWSWYDPQALESFEDRIEEAFAPYDDLPSNFGKLLTWMFVLQRTYLNKTLSAC